MTEKKQWGPWIEVEKLGEGGQGQTYLVEQAHSTDDLIERLARGEKVLGGISGPHVLKTLKRSDRLHRMKGEIEACNSLSHPNVLRIVDYDLEAAEPWLVSEYHPLGALSRYWYEHPPSPIDVLSVFIQVCDALAHAHANGIIHRDIKPDNIFMRSELDPVVGDFGICHFIDGERYTLTREIVGARNFAPPEAEVGPLEDVGPTFDVYSLGKLLYWMCWGEVVYRETHRTGVKYMRLTDDAPAWYHFVYEILDVTIVEQPDRRCETVQELLNFARRQLTRVEDKAHAIGPDIPQHCNYCGIGTYRVVLDPNNQHQDNREEARNRWGLRSYAETNRWRVQACDHCGNVQTFRIDQGAKTNQWLLSGFTKPIG